MSKRATALKANERMATQIKAEGKGTFVVSSGGEQPAPAKKAQETFDVASAVDKTPKGKHQKGTFVVSSEADPTPKVKKGHETFAVSSGVKQPAPAKKVQETFDVASAVDQTPKGKKPKETYVVSSGVKQTPSVKNKQGTFLVASGLGEQKAATSTPVPISDQLGYESIGQYLRSDELLGEGSFGKVYLGVAKDTGVLVAVKVMKKIKVGSIKQEVDILQSLATVKCPNLVNLLDYKDDDKKLLYLIFEHCPTTLSKYLSTLESESQCMIVEEVRLVLVGLAEGLMALSLHKPPIIHRDIKPDNILLTIVNGTTTIKLADFGTSRLLVDGDKAETVCGTYEYMAPEVLLGIGHDQKADTYSVGVVGTECATGELPFGVTQRKQMANFWRVALPAGFMPNLPASMNPSLKELLRGLLQCESERRFDLDAFYNHPFLRVEAGPSAAGARSHSGTYDVKLPSVTYLESVYRTALANFSAPGGTFTVEASGWDEDKKGERGGKEAGGGQGDMRGMMSEPVSGMSKTLEICRVCGKSGKKRGGKSEAEGCHTCYDWHLIWAGSTFQCMKKCSDEDEDPCNQCQRTRRLAKCEEIFGPRESARSKAKKTNIKG